jgi:hypothetical protein
MANHTQAWFSWIRDGLISLAAGIATTLTAFLVGTMVPAILYALAPGVFIAMHVWPSGIMGGEAYVLGLIIDSFLYGLGCILLLRLRRRLYQGRAGATGRP